MEAAIREGCDGGKWQCSRVTVAQGAKPEGTGLSEDQILASALNIQQRENTNNHRPFGMGVEGIGLLQRWDVGINLELPLSCSATALLGI